MSNDKTTSVNTLREESYLAQEFESGRVNREQIRGGAYRMPEGMPRNFTGTDHEGSALNNPRIRTG